MAVTKAREDQPNKSFFYDLNTGTGKVEGLHAGASGGLAPEGYGLANIIGQGSPMGGVENARVPNEGVAQRGAEEDEKRHKEADKFMKSKAEFDKKVEKSAQALAEGKDENPAKDAVVAEQKKRDEEALKKPTAAGGQTNLDNPVVAQSAEVTAKEEKADIQAAQAGNDPKKVEEAEKAKKAVHK